MKAELGQARRARSDPLEPALAALLPRPRGRLRPPRRAGHRPCPALQQLPGSHVSSRQGNGSVATRAASQLLPWLLPLAARSVGGSWRRGDAFREAGLGGLLGGPRRDTELSPSTEPRPSSLRGSSWPRCYVITPAYCTASGMMPAHLEHSYYARSAEKHRRLHLSPRRGSRSVRSGPADWLPRKPPFTGRSRPVGCRGFSIRPAWPAPPASPRSPQIPARDFPPALPRESTHSDTAGECGAESLSLRRCPARSWKSAWLSSDRLFCQRGNCTGAALPPAPRPGFG